jgi:hypothetical protein
MSANPEWLEEGEFPASWTVERLTAPPLIAPVRQFTYPVQVPGEEDALARGALQLLVRPRTGGSYLVTCALGFRDPTMPTAVLACPDPDQMCALAGGYAYLAETTDPESCTLLPMRPVTAVHALPSHGLLLFVGFHELMGWGADGLRWQSARLSYEGIRITQIEGHSLHGLGWNMVTDREVPFTVDLRTGLHTGGGFPLG